MPAFKQWSPAESDRLVELHKAGMSYREISKTIGWPYGSVKSRAHYLGLTPPRPPILQNQIDMGCKLRALANTNLSIDDCAIAMGITLERAFFLADWYHIKFHNGTPCDMETVENLLATKRTHTEIARIMGCSRQKVTNVAKLIKDRRDRVREVLTKETTNDQISQRSHSGIGRMASSPMRIAHSVRSEAYPYANPQGGQ